MTRTWTAGLCSAVILGNASVMQAGHPIPDPHQVPAAPSWAVFTDGFSQAAFTPGAGPGPAGRGTCGRLQWHLRSGARYPFAGMALALRAGGGAWDGRGYAGVRFYASGSGACQVNLPVTATQAEHNHYCAPIALTPEWQRVQIPFSAFRQAWGVQQAWDPSQLRGVEWTALGFAGERGELKVADMEFYTADEQDPPSAVGFTSLAPKANQVGYLPEAEKWFALTAPGAAPGDRFQVLDAGGREAYAAALTSTFKDDRRVSGEIVALGDFSGLRRPGRYVVAVNGRRSHPFDVARQVYAPLFRDSLRCLALARCGSAVSDSITGWSHTACHLQDGECRDRPGERAAVTGGWHNAGDYGKWCHTTAITIAYLLWCEELRPRSAPADLYSPVLDEARWGLDFLFRLQRPDGSIYHKVDTEPDFCLGTPPEKDPWPRWVSLQSAKGPQTPSSVDAGTFTAAMALAAGVWRGRDPVLAGRCRQAALRTWDWMQAHPRQGQGDAYYSDPDASQEELWAACEIYRLTRDPEIAGRLAENLAQQGVTYIGWMTPQALGWFSLARDQGTPGPLRAAIVKAWEAYLASRREFIGQSGYGADLGSGEYHWESNENLLHRAAMWLFGFHLTGRTLYRQTALRQLDYLLGCNALDRCFVSGYGSRGCERPYHWAYAAYGAALPGWVAGGPNGNTAGADPLLLTLIAQGTPPAKCYADACSPAGSWASNEGEITANAALVFLTGCLTW